jgi:hypothetical protein
MSPRSVPRSRPAPKVPTAKPMGTMYAHLTTRVPELGALSDGDA